MEEEGGECGCFGEDTVAVVLEEGRVVVTLSLEEGEGGGRGVDLELVGAGDGPVAVVVVGEGGAGGVGGSGQGCLLTVGGCLYRLTASAAVFGPTV